MGGTRSKIEPDAYRNDVNSGAKWLSGVLLLAGLSWGSYITMQVMNLKTDMALVCERQRELKDYHVRIEDQFNKLSARMDTHK